MNADEALRAAQQRIAELERERDELRQQLSVAHQSHASQEAMALVDAAFEATADGMLVVDVNGSVTRYNRRFLELWRIPPHIAEVSNDEQLIGFVLQQLIDPEHFLTKVRKLYGTPATESFDRLKFRDGRMVERYSRPLYMGEQIVGRVWSFRDISDRIQVEREREKLYEQLIASSTPLIPLNDDVVVMPLIGTVDARRAGQIIETLLHGIATLRVKVAIIDITGLLVVDTQVANALIHVAQAARLLGARAMLTGMRPEVAQMMVQLGIDLGHITTFANLQMGVQSALRV